MRYLVAFLALLTLSGCATDGSSYEIPLPRATYQKLNVTSYAGAGSEPGAPTATARGTRYQAGAISSAAADWARWPAGTLFRVLATGEIYEVDDYTDDVVGTNNILLYKPATASLANFNTHLVTIEIIKWGSYPASAALLQQQKSSTAKRILAELIQLHPEVR